MKGLILCAGKGTRLQPFSFSQPKTLLPVAGKAVLQYCVENLVKSGIKEIGIVMHPSQEGIPALIGNGQPFGCHVEYIYQTEQKGISHAVKQAEQFIGKDPFILLLGDNLIGEQLQTLIDSYRKQGSDGAILLSEVENPQDYGIAEIDGNEIVGLEEKPQQPKSNLAVIGAYLFESPIFEAVKAIPPSARGEYEITDAISWLLEQSYNISYTVTEKLYSDVGTVARWLDANQAVMRREWGDKSSIGDNVTLENCKIIPPVIIGANSVLKNAVIGPYVSTQERVHVENCQVASSILLEEASLKDLSTPIVNSVFGREVRLKGRLKGNATELNFTLGDKSSLNLAGDQDE
ncbi:glucose-1-phosphate thymidylyltransferase [Ammoniphilus oxalaticus]|uniref:Glucose-1-phosphate thymidylyltransferase n=1 Tax=Ammoniphilus oxalaticus TaxID=66863 RepID=A0A419SNB4_9BACL|nr:glucose-1-phosphate thymidylyltransferase [Ammoniphilus oxalaticus]RKD25767.1 glucose-1-phosphate thymidylyltransferase [Ammoniphilus oxalaticus]